MKAVILAGGFGSRLSEETIIKPKPMVEIGNRPILWHIMKLYAAAGIDEFVVCLGYKGWMIKEFFAHYFLRSADFTVDLATDSVEIHRPHAEPWKVTLIDTGPDTYTGGRLKRVAEHIDDTFCFTYGDGVSDVDIKGSIDFHRRHGKLATMTAVQPPGRFGYFELGDDHAQVASFTEKPIGDGGWVNGGFFVLEPKTLDYIEGDKTWWERDPMKNLAEDGQLVAYKHSGFWHCMDHLADKHKLDQLWADGAPPWKTWE
jgi:glucose-1-phosphate cytidylyltransferase